MLCCILLISNYNLTSFYEKDDVIVGYIKLGFIMSKGQFEIMIYEAKQLNKIDGNTNKGMMLLILKYNQLMILIVVD